MNPRAAPRERVPGHISGAVTWLLESNILLAQGKAAEARGVAALGVRELEETRGLGTYAVAMRLGCR
ncbi:hypothetical protein [Cystobacter fuscus]|uniref:hypothetical protein n=1 Tax=Cystobacter fuscus TaxID=43 RepID=UPI000BB3DB6C|nr:hypothetical protein [Cystobacter fuscus]